jgi:uncharacterized phage infection (PIP) family protein YhgE
MTNPSLSRVTLQSLENYRTAATQAVVATRLGGHRLVGALNGALKNSVYPRTAKLAPRATDRMNQVRGNVSEVVVKGIDQVAAGAEKAIELSSSTAAAQVNKVARFAAGVNNQIVANGLQAAARLTMPGAKAALAVSSQVAKGATALADAAGARPVRNAVRKAAAGSSRKLAPVARNAKATVKTAGRRVAKTMQAPVAHAQRAARTAKKAVARASAA